MTVYSSYIFYSGGYGDFIRSLLAFYAYCKENDINIVLYNPDHPINECLVSNTEKLNLNRLLFINGNVIQNNDNIKSVLNRCKQEDLIIGSNVFTIVENSVLRKYRNDFKQFIKLTEPVKQRISFLKNQINNTKYTSIHIRCGDKFMESKSHCGEWDGRIDPNTELLFRKVEKTIMWLKINYNLPICLFTDVNSLKTKLSEKYDLLKFDTVIHHTAMHQYPKNAYIDTVSEFELLGESVAVVKFTKTGFAFWSTFINSVPLFICDDALNIKPVPLCVKNDDLIIE